jgi:Ser/Thr protein kinase RdoA (MazF antagonist)
MHQPESSPAEVVPGPRRAPVDPSGPIGRVLRGFRIEGALVAIDPHERGHIHDTFISTWRQGPQARRYLHQRLNDRVFRDIPSLMHNIERVTLHLDDKIRQGQLDGVRTLRLVRARGGTSWVADATGPWRTYEFIEGTTSFDLCSGPEQAHEVAREFGRFQAELIDLDPALLRETIPQFFNSRHRLSQLQEAVELDAAGRVAEAAPEIAFVLERRDLVRVIDDCLADKRIPTRIVHGDTKLNNVLFDAHTGAAVCVVDLDTCMPAYSLYDFGDLVRFTAATSREDETDLARAGVDLELYRALVAGYRDTAGVFLTALEVELMPLAARLVTLTIGMRFLTDFLAGDVYFKTARPAHNLERARVQLGMVAAMERLAPQMAAS